MLENCPIVLAGNYKEFKQWCYEHRIPPSSAIFVDSSDLIIGASFPASRVARIGTFHDRPDCDAILTVVAQAIARYHKVD